MNFRALLINILNKLVAQKISVMWTALSPTLSGLSLAAQCYVLKYFVDPTGKTGFLLATLILGILPLLFATYFWFKPKLVFIENEGCWIDEKTRIRYCNSCKSKDKLSPLQRTQKYWRCTVVGCYQSYPTN